MFENTKTVKINGQCFANGENLPLLNNRFNLLYGRNGSGKSTIAKAIRLYADGKEQEEGFSVSFDSPISVDEKRNIYVFDEHFIDENVKINRKGIDTIVMLGEQVELDSKIKEAESKYEEIVSKIKALNERKDLANDPKNTNSHLYYRELISSNLKKNNGYADRERRIKGHKRNTSVSDIFIDEIINSDITTKDAPDVLRETLMQKIHIIEASKDSILISVVLQDISTPIDNELHTLLNRFIAKPNLDEYGKKIEALLQSSESKDKTHKLLLNHDQKVCPLCLQDISSNHREAILNVISQLYKDEAHIYRKRLQLYIDKLDQFPQIPSQKIEIDKLKEEGIIERNEWENFFYEYNSLIVELENVKKVIEDRKDDIYNPTKGYIEDTHSRLLNRCNESLKNFNNKVSIYNSNIMNRNMHASDASELNKRLACLENKEFCQLYKDRKRAYDKLVLEIDEACKQENLLKTEIARLQHEKDNVNVALDLMNEYLSYIFISKERMQLIASDGCYKLIVNNNNINVDKASVGERNILALVYYFVRIFQNQSLKDKYSTGRLLIIDDPISSFDFNNKIGILSFIGYQIYEFYKNGNNSKILLMSHDKQTIDYLKSFYEKKINRKYIDVKMLKDNKMHEIDIPNEHAALLNEVFQYVNTPGSELNSDRYSIGNKMRKILESISTFLYRCGVDDMLKNESLLDMLPNELRYYYEFRMFNLLFHADSHKERQVQALLLAEDAYDPIEQKKLAKMLLIFLYCIQKEHINSCLKDDAVSILNTWKQECIKKFSKYADK